MKNLTTAPELKRDLQILARYRESIEVTTRRMVTNEPENDFTILVQILRSVKKSHVQKLHEIINRNVKRRPLTVGDLKK